ncbi:hypothetical protein DL96DRAFT_569835 [Flagelloscypha sp. PMI_526]|nr:hypothetical protein DL96DRAFT_569835 [Flagelloscypha sp. PMI_526]
MFIIARLCYLLSMLFALSVVAAPVVRRRIEIEIVEIIKLPMVLSPAPHFSSIQESSRLFPHPSVAFPDVAHPLLVPQGRPTSTSTTHHVHPSVGFPVRVDPDDAGVAFRIQS